MKYGSCEGCERLFLNNRLWVWRNRIALCKKCRTHMEKALAKYRLYETMGWIKKKAAHK